MTGKQKREYPYCRREVAFVHGEDQMKPPRPSCHIIRLLIIVLGAAFASGTAICEEASPAPKVKVRYRMPSIVMAAHADWPKDPKYRDAMAKFVVAHGFNVVEGGVEVLDVCRENGLMVQLGGDQATLNIAPKLRDDPAVFGYFVSDRRRRDSFPTFAKIARIFEKADPNHPTIFINRAAWNEFGDFAKEVKPMLLDFYHYHAMPRRHADRYYLYLLMFRGLGEEHGIPVMRCTSSSSPPAVLRQTIYTSLAYGVKGFHFWTPWIFAHEKDKEGNAVLKDGKLSMYVTLPHLTDIAKEVRKMSPVLADCRSVAMYHTDPLPISGAKAPGEAWCQPSGSQILLGVLKDEKGGDFLLVTNRHPGMKQEATLSFDKTVRAVEQMDKKTGKWNPFPLAAGGERRTGKLNLVAGDGELLKVARAGKE
jgi:hypothetical protein